MPKQKRKRARGPARAGSRHDVQSVSGVREKPRTEAEERLAEVVAAACDAYFRRKGLR